MKYIIECFLQSFPSVKAALLTMLEECRILRTQVFQTRQDLTAIATQLKVTQQLF